MFGIGCNLWANVMLLSCLDISKNRWFVGLSILFTRGRVHNSSKVTVSPSKFRFVNAINASLPVLSSVLIAFSISIPARDVRTRSSRHPR